MASVRKRGNAYQIRVSCGYNSFKKQIVKTMTYKPQPNMTEKQIEKEVKRQAVLFEEKCRTGTFLDGNIRLCDFLEKWFSDYAETQLKAKTIARYKALIPRINPEIGHLRLDRLQPYHLLEFYNHLSESGIREDTRYRAVENFAELMAKKRLDVKLLSAKAGISEYVVKSCLCRKNISKKTAEKILKLIPRSIVEVENNRPLAPKTIQQYHRFLSSVLSVATQWQIIPYNPCTRVKPPKAERKEAVFLDDVQVFELINALEKEPLRYKTMIMLLLYSGMRRGELCGLEWNDIDFENNIINISRSSLYLPEKGIYDDTTKNKFSERSIKVPANIIRLLKEHKKEQNEEILKKGIGYCGCKKVFMGFRGKPIHPDTITGWFHKFVIRNGLPNICLHSLRHTNATLLITNGTDIKTVSSRLGHSTTATTGNIYAHALKSADDVAAQKLDEILNPLKRTNKGQISL